MPVSYTHLDVYKRQTIYDVDDQKRLYKEIMAELDIDPKRFPVNALMNRISSAKNELVVPGDFEKQASDPVGKVAARVYARLQERLKAANAFDFDDLLLYAYLLLKNHEDVRAAYQQRFRYLMVDEYQDTNHAQYAITQLLAEGHKNIMVVGDDDQSIYLSLIHISACSTTGGSPRSPRPSRRCSACTSPT